MTEAIIINWFVTPGAKELLDRTERPPLRNGLPPRESFTFKSHIKTLMDANALGWTARSQGAEYHVTFPNAAALQWFNLQFYGNE